MKWLARKHIHGLVQMKRRYRDTAFPASHPGHEMAHGMFWTPWLPRPFPSRLPWQNPGPVPLSIRQHPEF